MNEYSRQFEELVCELYRRKGYVVKPQVTLVGRSGANHRLDAYCFKGKVFKKQLAIEAKYSNNGLPVSIDDFSRFLTALEDCGISEGHVVTNTYFSENIFNLAVAHNIKLVDGVYLKRELKKYNLSHLISTTSVILENFGIPIAKLILNYLDNSGTLSKILLPRSVLYIDFSNFVSEESLKETVK